MGTAAAGKDGMAPPAGGTGDVDVAERVQPSCSCGRDLVHFHDAAMQACLEKRSRLLIAWRKRRQSWYEKRDHVTMVVLGVIRQCHSHCSTSDTRHFRNDDPGILSGAGNWNLDFQL